MSKYAEFNKPPVVEVVFGVLFSTPQPIKVVHVGLFWEKVRRDFGRVEEVPPLIPVLECFDPVFFPEPIQFDSTPRTWFLSEDGQMLIQIQKDRFLFNWKRTTNEDPYPFYDHIAGKFEGFLKEFAKLLLSEGIGEIFYRQFELTYVNHIDAVCGAGDVDKEVLVDHMKKHDSTRFLPAPDSYNWKTSYPLPEQEGRLHVVAQLVLLPPTMKRVTQLEMTVRGISKVTTDEERKAWFEMAHEWIVKGFIDVTTPEWQERWEKRS